MKTLVMRRFLILSLFILGIYWSPVLTGQTEARLSVTLSTPTTSFKIGSDVRVDIEIKNVSQGDIAFLRTPGMGRGELDVEIEVTDEQGNSVQATKYWNSLKKYGIEKVEGSRISIQLKPGESFKNSVILNKLYDLSTPGSYTIRATKRIPKHLGGGVVKSNSVTMNLTAS